MSRRPTLQTQFIIFILFGDWIAPRGGQAWTAGLLHMLQLLGVSQPAARSTLSRMAHKGWLKSRRNGRHSRHVLTEKGKRLLDEGGQRIFEPRKHDWDRRWHLAVYSLPESKRKLRNDLRKRLTFLGFGPLERGTWISPNDRRLEVEAMLDDLGARKYVQLFSGIELVDGEQHSIIQRCWDLQTLNRRYAEFIARWEPELEKVRRALASGRGLAAERCFVQRFWIVQEYSAFPQLDPNLPAALLPRGWLGDKAAGVFSAYSSLVNEPASRFVDAMLRGPNGRSGRG